MWESEREGRVEKRRVRQGRCRNQLVSPPLSFDTTGTARKGGRPTLLRLSVVDLLAEGRADERLDRVEEGDGGDEQHPRGQVAACGRRR